MSDFYIANDIDNLVSSIKNYDYQSYLSSISWADESVSGIITHKAHYEMEKCNTPVVFNDKLWNETPKEIKNNDQEWNFAFARHSILLNLAKAFAYTKDEKYRNTFIDILSSFFTHADKTGLSWRSLECGIRPENWIRSIEIFDKTGFPLPEKLLKAINDSLSEHIRVLIHAHRPFQRLSNWGIIQEHGLFVASLYLNNKETLALSLDRLEEECINQILDDGTHWEQTPLYHIEILHSLLDTLFLARKHNINVSDILIEKTRKASLALYSMISSDGHIFLQGDSDWIECDDLIFTAKKLFPDIQVSAEKKEENFWDFGSTVEEVESNKKKSVSLSYSHNTYFRGANIESHLYSGNIGSGHGHISPLHVDIYAHNMAFIVDSGRYTYTDSDERYNLKSLKAHNTVILDNLIPNQPIGSWGFTSIPLTLNGTTILKDTYDYTEGTNLSYLEEKSAIRRKMVRLGDNIIVILDEIISNDSHNVDTLWHIVPSVNIIVKSNNYIDLERDNSKLLFWTNADELKIEDSNISLQYNELENNKTIIATTKTNGITTIVSVFSSSNTLNVKKVPITLIEKNRTLTDNEGIALEIENDNEKWIILSRAREIATQVDILKSGSMEGYGMTMIKNNLWKYPESIF